MFRLFGVRITDPMNCVQGSRRIGDCERDQRAQGWRRVVVARGQSSRTFGLLLVATLSLCSPAWSNTPGLIDGFVNWESPHVHPLDLTPNGSLLLAVNTADARLEVFIVGAGTEASISRLRSIPVGLEPVTVRARSNTEAWVINHISDSVSIVDLVRGVVTNTVVFENPLDPVEPQDPSTGCDEPTDVVFAQGSTVDAPELAFLSCSQSNRVLVLDPEHLDREPRVIQLQAEDPRSLAVSPDGAKVYAAIFESGNGTTILQGGSGVAGVAPVSDLESPYGGTNPPPNDCDDAQPLSDCDSFHPPKALNGVAPPVAHIVRREANGNWLDDTGADWTDFVSGSKADRSLRYEGWELLDHDIAVIDTDDYSVNYIDSLVTLGMVLAVSPQGEVALAGTEALNQVRFEPNLKGRFFRVMLATYDPTVAHAEASQQRVVDLNGGHLDYSDSQIAQQADSQTADPSLTTQSIGDPRGVAWHPTAPLVYITGLGSNNLIAVSNGVRTATDPSPGPGSGHGPAAAPAPVEVGEGPTGLVVTMSHAYVLNRFSGSVSVVDLAAGEQVQEAFFYDPTPAGIRDGRKFLYDTHLTSGMGHVSCGSCHADAKNDRLAWDLGDPGGEVKPVADLGEGGVHNFGMGFPGLDGGFVDFHPMKGPMVTQTLQAIVGMEPLHWRGDRDGLEEFNGAFPGLLGSQVELDPVQMQQFEDFVASLTLPPNPYRRIDNLLPTSLALPGHYATGRFADSEGLAAGTPLPPGDATRAVPLYRDGLGRPLDINLSCVLCHALPTGAGADVQINLDNPSDPVFAEPDPGPFGERHLALVSADASSNRTLKVPQLRTLFEKTGLEFLKTADGEPIPSQSGFGFIHDGSVDSLTRFISLPPFGFLNDQEIADMVAFMLSLSGSDLPEGSHQILPLPPEGFLPPGPPSQDTHAGVGQQLTFSAEFTGGSALPERLALLISIADDSATQRPVQLIAKQRVSGVWRGYLYTGDGQWNRDQAAPPVTTDQVLESANGAPVTFTVVVAGTGERMALDRDSDGALDYDEFLACSDPGDPDSVPGILPCALFLDDFETGDASRWDP